MSVTNVAAPTRTIASPSPVNSLNAIRSASELASAYAATLAAAMSAPATIRMRRPFRSPIRPAIGCDTRIMGLTAPMTSATPKLPTPSSSFAYTGRITSSIPIDMHVASSASTVSTNGFVRTRSGCTLRSKQNDLPGPVSVRGVSEGISVQELQLAARNHALPLEALRWDVTPIGLHYLLIHYDIPVVDPKSWRLEIDGLVERPVSLSIDDLRSRPALEVTSTMECAGNGRVHMEPH